MCAAIVTKRHTSQQEHSIPQTPSHAYTFRHDQKRTNANTNTQANTKASTLAHAQTQTHSHTQTLSQSHGHTNRERERERGESNAWLETKEVLLRKQDRQSREIHDHNSEH